jgi:hypothetical protein
MVEADQVLLQTTAVAEAAELVLLVLAVVVLVVEQVGLAHLRQMFGEQQLQLVLILLEQDILQVVEEAVLMVEPQELVV